MPVPRRNVRLILLAIATSVVAACAATLVARYSAA